MKAVILAAGKGTRMGELTSELPKPMLLVQGKPILEHILEGLMAAGIRDFFIVTGFRAEVIESYFGDGAKWNVRISFGRQMVQDGTGKAPEVAKQFVGDDNFVLTYGDILVRPQTYHEMLRRYGDGGDFSGLVTCTGSEDVTKGGLFFFDKDFCLEKLVEKPSAAQLEGLRREGRLRPGETAWYNAGIYIFKPLLFGFTGKLAKSPRGEYELTDALTAMLETGHRLAGLEIQGRWVDVRDPQVLAALEKGETFPSLKPVTTISKDFNQNAASGDFEFRALQAAVNYKRLLVKEIGPVVRGRAIEIGAGIGQMTAVLRESPGLEYLQCIEPEPAFCAQFRSALPDQPLIQGTIKDSPAAGWDAIVSINVLEHIERDGEELALYHERLKAKRGALVLFVPARPELYAQIDRDFGHYRRYTRTTATAKLTGAGFKIEKIRYFDFVGYFAWLMIFRLARNRGFTPGSVRLFDRLIFPAENFIESKICAPPVGKNLLVIARAN